MKRTLVLVVDALLCVGTVLFAYYLRLGVWVIPVGTQWLSVVASPLLAIPLFVRFGLYRAIFRYSGWPALGTVLRAGVIYGLLYATLFTLIGIDGVPRTVGLIQPILLFSSIGAARALASFWLGGGYGSLIRAGERRRVMIYGAGAAGRQLAAALATDQEMLVAGFVDDDPTLQGSLLNGKAIYSSDNLAELFERQRVDDVLLALPSATQVRRNEILSVVRATHVCVRTLPGLTDLAQGRIAISDLRELDIEDLLGRDAVAPNLILLGKNITGKTVLVTGAGGSIGSELCRQIVKQKPSALLLLESNEFALYSIHQELEKWLTGHPQFITRLLPLLGSVLDHSHMTRIMSTWRPNTVYHAAAYKHVPLVEHNPAEGVRNNTFGTLVTARAARDAGVQDFVLISTDKAVRPTNVMGTSKRLAEMTLQAMAAEKGNTRFSMVRFGNVLDSSGSVVPLFRNQIKHGGPVTITHKEITRYFMTIPEAAQLVIQSGAMATGGEVFVLDMGNPVKIADLARNMIELSGFSVRDTDNPHGDIEIAVIGLRPGEKLYEELLIGDNPSPTHHSRILKANEAFFPWPQLAQRLDALKMDIESGDAMAIRLRLREMVSEFSPDEGIVDLFHLEEMQSAG